jgi:ParB family chromosome partitioning protein
MENKIILLKNVHPNPDNPRIQAGDVTDLAASIQEVGLIDPLLVIPAPWLEDSDEPDERHYMIEDGYRRWVACRTIFEEVECRIRIPGPEEDLAHRAIVTALATSLHRVGLSPMERARAYGRLRDQGHLTHARIAELAGVGESAVSSSLMLLDLAPKAQQRVEAGTLKVKDAVEAIKQHRAKSRKSQGKKPIDVGWEPDHFTKNHHLAKRAKTMCDAREHSGRRRLGAVACGQCWETVIRQDEVKVQQASMAEAGIALPFVPPLMTAGTRKPESNGSSS